LDYLDRFSERVSAVSAQQVRDAFLRRLHPERMATVIVGPRDDRVVRASPGSAVPKAVGSHAPQAIAD
jgi:zinc protease